MGSKLRVTCLAIIVWLNLPGDASAATRADCERLEDARARIFQQLRRSHSAARGNQLRARLREINVRIAAECR